MQKTNRDIGCRQKGRTESESYGGTQTYMGIVDDNLVEVQLGKDDLLERILSRLQASSRQQRSGRR
ncbi:MAG: hypothetical protein J6Y37_08780 [Paludibacteraceae bacterium]|nr:hypothetical protein [Paludibacteraceae bacterium]